MAKLNKKEQAFAAQVAAHMAQSQQVQEKKKKRGIIGAIAFLPFTIIKAILMLPLLLLKGQPFKFIFVTAPMTIIYLIGLGVVFMILWFSVIAPPQ